MPADAVTALQLIIYAHENLYGGDWADVDFTGNPGSSYFQGGLFGRDENLNYYLNGQYPLASGGWGATSDQIVLKAGDFIDLAGFTSWDFYQDSAYGFHFFADANGDITHSYTVEAGMAFDVKLVKGSKDYEYNSVFFDVPDYTIHYGTALYDEMGTATTDADACASITFPEAGTYYLWVDGGYGNEYPDSIVSAPGFATVTEAAQPDVPETPREAQDVSAVLNATMAQLAATVTEPVFGTTAGEWTVLSLARGNHFTKDNDYFTNYYSRIVDTVNSTAASVNLNGALYDYSDVTFDAVVTPESDEMTAALGVPAEVEGTAGTEFNAVISINKWDNEAGYKLIDFIMPVPAGLSVTDVIPGDRLTGGEVSWNLDAETGKLRVVYFDANENSDLTISGTEFPAELFTIGFKQDEDMTAGTKLDFAISGMSVKLNSNSEDEASMIIVNTTNTDGTAVGGSSDVVQGISFSMVPSNGVILKKTTVTFYEGESVFDVLQRVCKEKGIHNLYEFDCGNLSGWMYRVNGWYPNYGCSRYQLADGDTVEWRFTCDLGNDVGRSGSW